MPTVSKNSAKGSSATQENVISELQQQNKDLENKLNLILSMLQNNNVATTAAPTSIEVPSVQEEKVFTEPEANKNIKVMSLCYGTLNLSDGVRNPIKFEYFGQIKNILYSTLVSIVNQQTSFAEQGKFYICDENAVYNLGLYNAYQNIFDYKTLTNICSFSVEQVEDIMSKMNSSQKEILVQDIVTRMCNNESFDLNKLDIVSKHTDINFQKELEEYKKYETLRKH